jgi:DNA polymerase V
MNEDELEDKGVSLHAGFPNAAVGSSARQLDLTQLLIKHPPSTYLMRLDSNAWNEQGMFSGDIIIIDRALTPKKTDHVIWWEGDNFTIGKRTQVPKDLPIWGVVSAIIHKFRG